MIDPNFVSSFRGAQNTGEAVVGLYYANGVFCESETSYGMTFFIDQLIYETMAASITDKKIGKLRAKTLFGFSEFMITCEKRDASVIEHIIMDVISNIELILESYGICAAFADLRKPKVKTYEQLYYEKRVPGSRLTVPIAGNSIHKTTTKDKVAEWYRRCFCDSQKCIVISDHSQSTVELITKNGEHVMPYICNPQRVDPPKCILWEQSSMIVGFDHRWVNEEIPCAEAVCLWLKPQLAAVGAKLAGRIHTPNVYLEGVSELRIACTGRRGREMCFSEEIARTIRTCADWADSAPMEKLRRAVHSGHLADQQDLCDWNHFLGWNAITGNRFQVKSLLDYGYYEEAVTADKVRELLRNIVNCDSPALFVTARR